MPETAQPPISAISPDTFFKCVRENVFGGTLTQGQVGGLNVLLDKWKTTDNTDLRQLAYILATAKWETANTLQPVREAFWLSEEWRKENLRYWPYYGRGYVQLTWKDNYAKFGSLLSLDLISDPDLALEPATAAQILFYGMEHGSFTGAKLSDYINSTVTDFVNARRIVNGTDHAHEIAAIAQSFYRCLQMSVAHA